MELSSEPRLCELMDSEFTGTGEVGCLSASKRMLYKFSEAMNVAIESPMCVSNLRSWKCRI